MTIQAFGMPSSRASALPSSTIASGDSTKDTTLALSGTAEAGASVVVFDGATSLGNATLTGTQWTYTTSARSDGLHTFTAQITDAVGNTATTAASAATTSASSTGATATSSATTRRAGRTRR